MAKFGDITVTGVKDVDETLAGMPPKLAKKLERRAVRQSAKEVADVIKQGAPKDEGKFQKSIKVRAMKRSRKNKGTVGASVVSSTKTLKDEDFYPSFIEFGSSHQEPQAPFRRGMVASTSRVLSIFVNALRSFISGGGK